MVTEHGSPHDLLAEVRSATERLTATVERLQDDRLAEPSLLPGWVRAHVLTHIARNADGVRNLLLAVRSGVAVRMYASPTARAADIDAGSSRPPDVIRADAVESSRRFLLDAECMPADRWHTEIPFSSGGSDPPRVIAGIRPLEMRLREVEFHHVDLNTGYSFADTPDSLLEHLMADTVRRLGRDGFSVRPMPEKDPDRWIVESAGESLTVQGAARDVLAWLSGRSDGAGLAIPRSLPAPPSLG